MKRFKIGDKVTNKKLGQVIIGQIDGILPGCLYNSNNEWEKYYPEWRKNYVIYVKVDQLFQNKYQYLVFPLDDVILMEDVVNEDALLES